MKVLRPHLPEETTSNRQEATDREQVSLLSIEEKLAQLEDDFRRSAEFVLQKNSDLYRRLS